MVIYIIKKYIGYSVCLEFKNEKRVNFRNDPFYHLVVFTFVWVLFCSVLFCASFKKTGQRFGAVVGVLHPPLFTVERVVLSTYLFSTVLLKGIFAYMGLCIQLSLYVSLASLNYFLFH